ncbi:MAG: protein kinase [Bacilli bacterium]|nr:protein kinase [Bacilli bacterium]
MDFKGKKTEYKKQKGNSQREGGSGYVYFVENEIGDKFAIKQLKMVVKEHKINSSKKNRFLKELEFQKNAKCKYIAKIIDESFDLENEIFYVMRQYKCNFRELMINNIPKKKMMKYILNICEALKYIGKKGIVHRDIKPENILYDSVNDIVVLSDFGISHFPDQNITDGERLANFNYHAPEQKEKNESEIGTHTDIFALGLIINEIFTGDIPQGKDYKKIKDCYPEYYYLDEIVAIMIQSDIEKREKNIENIIKLIKSEKRMAKDLVTEISDFAKSEINKLDVKNKSKLIKQVEQDLLKGYLYQINEIKEKNVNPNYHCNVSYSLDRLFIDSIKLVDIYLLCEKKFNYESNIYEKDNFYDQLNYKEQEHLELYNKFIEILSKLKFYKDYEYLEKRSLKLFSSLCDYHAREIIEDATKIIEKIYEEYIDAPLFWIILHLDKYKSYLSIDNKDFYIFIYLSITEYHTNSVIEQDNYYSIDFYK